MSWVRIDDHAPRHPKQLQAGPMACWLWVCGLSYCSEHLTDGHIPSVALLTFNIPRPEREAERLVEVGLWESTKTGYRVHDYHEYQPSKGQVTERKRRSHERVTDWRKRHGYAHGNDDVTPLLTPMKRECKHPPVPDPDPIGTDTSLRSVSDRARDGDDATAGQADAAPPPPEASRDPEAGARLWEMFRVQALTRRQATLPLSCRAAEWGSVQDLLSRYPDPGKQAWLIEAFLTSRHRPILAAPVTIGQVCKWAPWLEAQSTAPAPDSPRTAGNRAAHEAFIATLTGVHP